MPWGANALRRLDLQELQIAEKNRGLMDRLEPLAARQDINLYGSHVPQTQSRESGRFQQAFLGAPQQRVEPVRIHVEQAGAVARPASFARREVVEVELGNSRRRRLEIHRIVFGTADEGARGPVDMGNRRPYTLAAASPTNARRAAGWRFVLGHDHVAIRFRGKLRQRAGSDLPQAQFGG